jgi:hypothetical protein
MDENRFLKHHIPLIAKTDFLPVNYQFTQFYAGIAIDSEGKEIIPSAIDQIVVSKYQTQIYNSHPSLAKPISKIIPYDPK